MTPIDLEKYKAAWKNEQGFNEKTLSETEVQHFMQSASKHIATLFKKGLVFDIVFKLVLLVSFVVLAFLVRNQPSGIFVATFFILIIIAGIVWQFRVFKKIPNTNGSSQNLRGLLLNYLDFYNKSYISAIFVGALSSTLLFLGGSLFYLIFKYHEIPRFQIDDSIVLGIGLVLSFVLSAFAQIKQNNFHITQLEDILKDIDERKITEQSIKRYRNKKLRNIILIGIALIVGILLLLFFTFKPIRYDVLTSIVRTFSGFVKFHGIPWSI